MAKMGAVVKAVALLTCTLAVAVDAANTTSGFPVLAYYVLGDSYMDAGNNNLIANQVPKANFKPYGMTYFKGVPTGRFSDGRIFSDLLAVLMKLPQALPSLSNPTPTIEQKGTGINFASGGAAILPSSSAALGYGKALSFEFQVIAYEILCLDLLYALGVEDAQLIINGAIYHVSFGAADIIAFFTKPAYATTVGPISKFLTTLAFEYRVLVERVYRAGARKVVVFGIGPIHKSPLVMLLTSKMTREEASKACAAIDSAAKNLNKMLLRMVTEFNADSDLDQEHASLQLVFADVYGAVMDISKIPATHGLTDVRNACCGAGKFGAEVRCGATGHTVCKSVSKSLYWNEMQFTEAGHKRLFKLFFDGSSFVKPFSIKHLAKKLIPGVPY